jgi:MFS family permease
LLACFAAIAEGSAVDWSALHIKTGLAGSDAEAALGVGGFSVMMAIMRFFGDRLVDKFGRLTIVRFGSFIASVGILFAVLAASPWQAVIGWSLLGAGVSGVIPQLFIAGGNIGEETHSGRNMAKVVGLTYFGIMAGPAIFGFLTNWIPLNLALGLGSALCLVVALSAGVLRSEKIR